MAYRLACQTPLRKEIPYNPTLLRTKSIRSYYVHSVQFSSDLEERIAVGLSWSIS